MIESFLNMDSTILLWIQEHLRVEVLNPVFIIITTLGNGGAIWIISSAAMLVSKKTRKAGLMCLCALIISVLVNNLLLKNMVGRARPFESISGIIPLIPLPTDYSFPSGHSAASFACAWTIMKELPRKYGVFALILAALIAFSRLYIGVHYPSDVLSGIFSGIIISYLSRSIVNTFTSFMYNRKE